MKSRDGLLRWVAFLVTAALLAAAPAWARDGIKERMRERLPAISALKAQGIIGESSQGFLDYLGNARPQEDLVRAENADRQTVYSAIARESGTTPELVGQRRARQLWQRARPGEWLQGPDGRWQEKR
ncbi:MAG: YdbL family protein [Thermodesulfobacteriota bacterium]